MLLLDILILTLVVLPWMTDWVWFDLRAFASLQPSDFGGFLLIVALLALAVRRWRDAFRFIRSGSPAVRRAAVMGAALMFGFAVMVWALRRQGIDLGVVLWELTHGTAAVAVVALTAVAIRRWSDEPWERSFFVRIGVRIGSAWLAAVAGSAARSLWSAAGVVATFFFLVAVMRHRAFETHGYDLGIFTNAIWNLTHGFGYVSSVKGGINLFADHQSPLFWLLAPIFWGAPRAETLLLAQAVGLAAGGPALYYLTRERFGSGHWAPAALPWLYWTYLPLRNANAFEFHPEVFMLPLFLWAFAAFAARSTGMKALGLVALAGALGAKESAGVVAFGIGAAWAVSARADFPRDRWAGVVLAAVGLGVFLFDVKLVPRMFGVDYPYMGLYGRFGGGLTELIAAPFTQPGLFFSQFFDRARLDFLFWTLAPLGFLPLFNWRAALAALPPYLMLFLSEGDQRVQTGFHYGIEPGTALFWALPLGLTAFARRFGWRRTGLWMLFWVFAAFGTGEATRAVVHPPEAKARWLTDEVLPCLSAKAPTAATDALIPHLATRAWISYPDQLAQRPAGEPVSCVVSDLELGNWPLGKGGVERILMGLPERGYHEAWKCGSFSVYERRGAKCLKCLPSCRR